MRILVVATKAPWPPVDGGRLALLNTLVALHAAGQEVTLVAPSYPGDPDGGEAGKQLEQWCRPILVPTRRTPLPIVALRWLLRGRPLTIARHALSSVRTAVRAELERVAYDVVHVEQVQAMAQASPAQSLGVPIVLRQQNLEHLLWRFSAGGRGRVAQAVLGLEERRLAKWERRAVQTAAATVALTREDARLLADLLGNNDRIHTIEAPFDSGLPAHPEPCAGEPALVMLLSGRWQPNIDLARRFVAEWWPAIRRRAPRAVAHIFGLRLSGQVPDGIVEHPAPADSVEAFPRGGVVVLSARHCTGVPMKGLEAWSRGLAVVASPEAARSLGASHGRELLVGADPEDFADAVARLADESGLYDEMVKAGREKLAAVHDGAHVAERLITVYREAGANTGRPGWQDRSGLSAQGEP